MNKKEFKELLLTGEGYHLEFKESLEKTFIEEVCAFANSAGGKLLLGVADNGIIKGCNTDNRFRSQVQDFLKQIEPPLKVDFEIFENVFIIHVPEGPDKPYGCSRGFFMRIGPNSQKLSRNDIISFFQKEGKIRFDQLVHEKARFDEDFDDRAFGRFLQLAKISPILDKERILQNLDCLVGRGKGAKLTNAGVLFFTRSIDFLLNHAIVRCALYKGTTKVKILDQKDFDENILSNIDNAVLFVMRHINLEFKIESIRRQEIAEIPEVAIREAITNAVCHRDYFARGSNVMVEVFDDRVVVSNPGGLPAGMYKSDFGFKSVCRNPLVASLLHRVDFIEKMGTGIGRIQEALAENGNEPAQFQIGDFFTVSFNRPKKMAATIQETSVKTSVKTSGKILEMIAKDSKITIPQMAEKLGKTSRNIEMQISNLKKEGKIKRIGSAKGGHWQVLDYLAEINL